MALILLTQGYEIWFVFRISNFGPDFISPIYPYVYFEISYEKI